MVAHKGFLRRAAGLIPETSDGHPASGFYEADWGTVYCAFPVRDATASALSVFTLIESFSFQNGRLGLIMSSIFFCSSCYY